MRKLNKQSGIALITTLLFAGVLLAIVFTLSGIFLPKLRTSSQSKNSVTAIYAAESGLEWCLYIRGHKRREREPAPVMGNNSEFFDKNGDVFNKADCLDVSPVTVLGEFRGVTRAFEISF